MFGAGSREDRPANSARHLPAVTLPQGLRRVRPMLWILPQTIELEPIGRPQSCCVNLSLKPANAGCRSYERCNSLLPAGSESSLNPDRHEGARNGPCFRHRGRQVSEALRTCFDVRIVRVKSVGPHKGGCFPTEPHGFPEGRTGGTALSILWQNPRSGREIEEMLMA